MPLSISYVAFGRPLSANGRVSIIFGESGKLSEEVHEAEIPSKRVCRIDKYYMLVRKFINASFRLLVREEWSPAVCEEYNHIIGGVGGPL